MHSVEHEVEYALARIRHAICIDKDCRPIGSTFTLLASPSKFWRLKRLLSSRSTIKQVCNHETSHPYILHRLDVDVLLPTQRTVPTSRPYSCSDCSVRCAIYRVISYPAYDCADRSVSSNPSHLLFTSPPRYFLALRPLRLTVLFHNRKFLLTQTDFFQTALLRSSAACTSAFVIPFRGIAQTTPLCLPGFESQRIKPVLV